MTRTTKECKDFLGEVCLGSGRCWKRISKKKVGDTIVRVFEGTLKTTTIEVYEDAVGTLSVLATSQWLVSRYKATSGFVYSNKLKPNGVLTLIFPHND